MRERTWFSIEEDFSLVQGEGVKMVCCHGFMAEYWKDDLWSFVETRGAYFPLSDLVESDDLSERKEVIAFWVDTSLQFQGEYHEAEALEMRDGYYHGDPGIGVCLAELSMDTPIGNYWYEED